MIGFEQPIPFAHYTDYRYNHHAKWTPQTVWGRERSDTFYNYSDRIEIDSRFDVCRTMADESGKPRNSPAWWQALLTAFHEVDSVDMHHVMTGVNQSNGYQYHILGYAVRRETPS